MVIAPYLEPMTRGIVFLSRIPPHLRPGKVRRLLEQHGEITNLYLAAADRTRAEKKKFGRGKRFVEGWVEFAEKKIANVVWVKIDTEGFDPHVLRGMEGALKAKTILGGIQFEYHLHYPTTAQYMKQSIHA